MLNGKIVVVLKRYIKNIDSMDTIDKSNAWKSALLDELTNILGVESNLVKTLKKQPIDALAKSGRFSMAREYSVEAKDKYKSTIEALIETMQ